MDGLQCQHHHPIAVNHASRLKKTNYHVQKKAKILSKKKATLYRKKMQLLIFNFARVWEDPFFRVPVRVLQELFQPGTFTMCR